MKPVLSLSLALGAALSLTASLPAAGVDPALLAGMKARSIGPAAMSGRIAVDRGLGRRPRHRIYVGAATGGVWKSINGGAHLAAGLRRPAGGRDRRRGPRSRPTPTSSGSAPARATRATASRWATASTSRSTAAAPGSTSAWRRPSASTASSSTRAIRDVAWVAAMGQAWGENPERGVFKTEDGGKTWRKVLYVDERTGAADLVIDPSNPNKLFAAMWDYRRWPWFFRSGGPGSGLYVTYDGGETWKRLHRGGRPAQGRPRADRRSPSPPPTRASSTPWSRRRRTPCCAPTTADAPGRRSTPSPTSSPRPFYYADIRVDPADPNRVYRLRARSRASTDGGKTFDDDRRLPRRPSRPPRHVDQPRRPAPHPRGQRRRRLREPRPRRLLALRLQPAAAAVLPRARRQRRALQRLRRPAGQRLLEGPQPRLGERRHPQPALAGGGLRRRLRHRARPARPDAAATP